MSLFNQQKGHRVERSTPAHAGPVYACARAGVKGYVTAGKDGFVRLWDGELQKLKQVNLSMLLGPAFVVNFEYSTADLGIPWR